MLVVYILEFTFIVIFGVGVVEFIGLSNIVYVVFVRGRCIGLGFLISRLVLFILRVLWFR